MEFWLLLILLVLLTYFIGKRRVASISQTPTTEPTSAPGETVPPVARESMLRPITKQEETELRNCFPWGVYYLQNVEYRPQAVLCRGKLRTNPDTAYRTVRENIEAEFGDRFFVIFQESLSGKPFFALVPNPYAQPKTKTETESLTRPGLALALLLITLFTTTMMGATQIAGLSMEQVQENPVLLLQGLSYAAALMAILSTHELGHYLVAILYKMRTTLPYFIPVPFFLGTFGAFIQMRSPVPNRKALFDVAIAGPIAGLVVTLPLLWWGLAHSSTVQLSEVSGLLNIDSLNPRFSLLLSLLSKWAMGSKLTLGMAIDLHPVAVAGYIGLVVTAFNLMPVGQLDGGHIVHAMFGQRMGAAIGQITRLLMLALALIETDLLVWAIILILMPVADEPALNDVSELDNWRDLSGFLALVILVSIVLPVPATIAGLLKI
ncbi:MAG TPA: site-2 protease family protein [Cyanobacteria bacterium UBA9273]|nr:site-2 protease family protein [Cyanobacteria bacterium UBA9273]